MHQPIYKFLIGAFAFVLGAAVGSFLNVCIYRWPVDLSINRPRRSFCPNCKQPIPWHQNLPLISWLVLGGRCANCGAKISFRYFAVELVTALLFLAIWESFPWQVAIAYWVFVSFLIIGTFIDFEHFIIPDRVTIGGIIAGAISSVAVPALMQTDSRLAAGVRSLLAAALGYVILLIVLEALLGENESDSMRRRCSRGQNAGMTLISWWALKKVYGAIILRAKRIDSCSSATRSGSTITRMAM